MNIAYDAELDILRIIFKDTPIEESDEEKEGIIFDYDKEGQVIGLEILDASLRGYEAHILHWEIIGQKA